MPKPYSGRLAFDSESGFHIDPSGKKVVTDDEGRTWRYSKRGDTSHNARHEQRVAGIDTTANAEVPEAHHWGIQPDDPHSNGLKADPDVVAEQITSHTAAWK